MEEEKQFMTPKSKKEEQRPDLRSAHSQGPINPGQLAGREAEGSFSITDISMNEDEKLMTDEKRKTQERQEVKTDVAKR